MSNVSYCIRRAAACAVLCITVYAWSNIASAQKITIDGRLSPAQTLTGPNYAIGANLGRQVGGNLFHSFGQFSLAKTDTATFSGPATVTNVIGRVTGGTASSIDGAIRSTISGANLYLINPSGIVFLPNATVNVSGSFHAASADYLRLADGAKFQATSPDGSTFSAAAPAAFGFLDATPGNITVNGSTIGVLPKQTLGLVGGPVSIAAGATLTAPSGTIHVASAAGAGEVPVDPANTAALTATTFGTVGISGASDLDVSDFIGKGTSGSIFVRSGSLTISDGGFLDATNYGPSQGGKISLRGDSSIVLSGGANVHAPATAAGRGGDIILTTSPTGSITASDTALVDLGTVSVGGSVPSGGSGQLTVTTGALTLSTGAIFGSSVVGSGNTGPISITANSIELDGRGPTPFPSTGIRSVSLLGASANAADITVNTGTLTIFANGQIFTNMRGAGNAGRVSVTATGAVSIDATAARFSTGIGSVVSPDADAKGNAGDMTINAASLSIVGAGPLVTLASPGQIEPSAQPFAGISTQTLSSGSGGRVALNLGGPLTLSNAGAISSSTGAAGVGGTVDATTQGALSLTGTGTAITTAALKGSSGPAGNVTLKAGGAVTISSGAQISSATAGSGKGGEVAVTAAGDMTLTGVGPQITARSTASGDAGSILVSALNLRMSGDAAISTEAATANGGNITLTVTDFMHLVDSKITTSVLGASGNGGNILIDPQLLVLDHSQIIAQAVLGHGGNITISAGEFLPSADSLVSATSLLGISGTIEILGPRVDLNGSLVILSGELRSAAALLRDSCAARSARPRSSLTEAGRGGLPQDPGAALPALYFANRDVAAGTRLAEVSYRGSNAAPATMRLSMQCW